MPGKTTYLTTKDFKEKGTLANSGFECTINNSFFRKGDSLNGHQIKEVLDICSKYHTFNINTLIVKDEELLTIWIEEKSETSNGEASESLQNKSEQSQIDNSSDRTSLPTKTVTKRYRGQVYEETVVDWTAVQQLKQQNKPPRKYRGQYID